MKFELVKTFVLGACLAAVVGCGEDTSRRRRLDVADRPALPTDSAPATAATSGSAEASSGGSSGWGTIKGRIVWGGADVPVMPELQIEKDKEYCLAKGPLREEKLVVDPATKGISNVFIYLDKPKGIHESYPQDKKAVEAAFIKEFEEMNGGLKFADLEKAIAEKKVEVANIKAPVLIDQVRCQYVPHAVAARVGEKTLVLNPETIAHNVKVSSISGTNDANPNMPPGTVQVFTWNPEKQPLGIACSIHGWMNMQAMVFDHPYFEVTGKDGSFEIKNVPAGDLALIIRNPKYIDLKGGKGSKSGNKVTVKPGETLDLGEIKISQQ